MAKPLPSINILGNDLESRGNTTDEANTSVSDNVIDVPANSKESEERKRQIGKKTKKGGMKGITPQSPTVYLLPEEKSFIKKLEAHILLMTDESITDHQLIMDAVREYAKKHYSDFKDFTS